MNPTGRPARIDPSARIGPSARWPAAWPHRYPAFLDRAGFVAAAMALTGVGLVLLGDPGASWWAIALPLLLLIGPAMRIARTPSALAAASRRTPVRLAEVRAGRVRLLRQGGGTLHAAAGPAGEALAEHVGEPALLVRRGRRAALVLTDGTVAYLAGRPR